MWPMPSRSPTIATSTTQEDLGKFPFPLCQNNWKISKYIDLKWNITNQLDPKCKKPTFFYWAYYWSAWEWGKLQYTSEAKVIHTPSTNVNHCPTEPSTIKEYITTNPLYPKFEAKDFFFIKKHYWNAEYREVKCCPNSIVASELN